MHQDYFLRLIDQIAIMLAEVARLVASGNLSSAMAELNERCRQTIGLNISQVQQMSPEALVQLLETAAGLRQSRAILLAELLLKDAELHSGNRGRESLDRLHAFYLLGEVVDSLDTDDQYVYRQKLKELCDYLGGLSNDPYIAGKLGQFAPDKRPNQAMQRTQHFVMTFSKMWSLFSKCWVADLESRSADSTGRMIAIGE